MTMSTNSFASFIDASGASSFSPAPIVPPARSNRRARLLARRTTTTENTTATNPFASSTDAPTESRFGPALAFSPFVESRQEAQNLQTTRVSDTETRRQAMTNNADLLALFSDPSKRERLAAIERTRASTTQEQINEYLWRARFVLLCFRPDLYHFLDGSYEEFHVKSIAPQRRAFLLASFVRAFPDLAPGIWEDYRAMYPLASVSTDALLYVFAKAFGLKMT